MLKWCIYSFLFITSLYSTDFKVVSYNVENFFDLHYDGTEYQEFRPYSKYWGKKAYYNKLHNIVKVLNNINGDIVALQEIESKKCFESLKLKLNYKYGVFLKNPTASIGVALLSRYKIINFKKLITNKYDKHSRYILRATVDISGTKLTIYINHWRSKHSSESKRILAATALFNDIKLLDKNTSYIIVGDLNSNYDEYLTFKYDKKLNDTYGITGINQVLNTTINQNFITKQNILNFSEIVHYNLWLELQPKNRFSMIFKQNKNTPDNIIVPKNILYPTNNICYINGSFNVFKPPYLIKSNKIKHWNMTKSTGYSDHLPIYAKFSTICKTKIYNIDKISQYKNNIQYLYSVNHIKKPVKLNNIKVIYKYKNSAIITQNKTNSILIFNIANNLKLGYRYDIVVNAIDTYCNNKEITSIKSTLLVDKKPINYEKYYLDGRKIDLFNTQYQNNIIKNLRGTYKKHYLYFRHNKLFRIRLYFDKGVIQPKNNSKIIIKSGHLTTYKSQIQIRIHKQTDFN